MMKVLKYYLKTAFVVGVPLISDPVCDWVNNVDLKKVSRRGIGVIQGLLLANRNKIIFLFAGSPNIAKFLCNFMQHAFCNPPSPEPKPLIS